MTERPTWLPIWLQCRPCGHAWDDWQPNACPIETWIAHAGTYRCPQCGASPQQIVLRTTPISLPP